MHPSVAEDAAAERLRRSEERYRLAVRAANDVIWDWDARTDEAEWSDALLAVFGWDPQVARRAPEGTHGWWSERVHPDDRVRVLASYDATLSSPDAEHWETEYRFRRNDGTWAHVSDRAFVLRDARGGVLRVVGAMRDISVRSQTMAALRESEARFRALVEASTSAVWRTDPDANVYEDLPGWRATTGFTVEQIQGRGWMDAVHPDDLERSKTAWSEARERREPFELVQRLRVADGSYRWFACRGVPVRDDAGTVREWVGLHEDVDSEHRRAAAERLLAAATDALTALDYDGALQRVAELVTEELADACVVHLATGDGRHELAAAASRDGTTAPPRARLATGLQDGLDVPAMHAHAVRTGDPVLVTASGDSGICVPIPGAVGTIGTITVVSHALRRDRRLTERELDVVSALGRRVGRAVEHAREYRDTARARAAAEAASAAKSDFLAVLSHEIRTPLNSIVGYAQLLSDAVTGPVSDEQRQQLRRIVSSADHLCVLIDEILTLSRLEAGREEARLERMDLCALVDEAMDIVALSAQRKGLRLVRDVPADGCVATTDRTKMLQVVVNLAGNAVKFTERGEVGFRIRTVDGRAEIEVRDTGVGIAPEHQRRIYEPFWQVEQRATQPPGGAGLGLSVVRHIMQLLGGGIRAESRAGEGSRFTVWVPVEGAATRE